MLETIIVVAGISFGYFLGFILDKFNNRNNKDSTGLNKEVEEIGKSIQELFREKEVESSKIKEEISRDVKNEDVAKFFNDRNDTPKQ